MKNDRISRNFTYSEFERSDTAALHTAHTIANHGPDRPAGKCSGSVSVLIACAAKTDVSFTVNLHRDSPFPPLFSGAIGRKRHRYPHPKCGGLSH